MSIETARELGVGDSVSLSGIVVTARDMAHKYIYNKMLCDNPQPEETQLFNKLQELLNRGGLYHCGPIMREDAEGWKFIAGGPTTSIREEAYEAACIESLKLSCIIGKGGMGPATSEALAAHGAVYLQAVGGAAAVAGRAVINVVDVFKLEFGMPEAMWVLELKNFPAIVTMDAGGRSLHAEIAEASALALDSILKSQI